MLNRVLTVLLLLSTGCGKSNKLGKNNKMQTLFGDKETEGLITGLSAEEQNAIFGTKPQSTNMDTSEDVISKPSNHGGLVYLI